MNININNSPAFQGGTNPAALKKAGNKAKLVLYDLPKGIVIENNKLGSFFKKVSRNVSAPEQRLIMGVTALFSQPYIDLNNKRVNEETRLMSFSRTLAKIIVGTTVGVLVRKGCTKVVSKYTQMDAVAKTKEIGLWAKPKLKHSFLAPDCVRTYNKDYHLNYVNALGSVSGILVSLFTNFLIDAPLTQIMTNGVFKFLKNVDEKPTQNAKDSKSKIISHKSTNLLEAKKISFSGNSAATGIEIAQNAFKKVKVSFWEKFVPDENKDPIFSIFDPRRLKQWFWKKVSVNPGSMLMHTGALGWAASSAAQITGIIRNDKIDSSKKKFLIPQEFADAAGNIALYYLLTVSFKRFVESLFEKGKIRIKYVMERIEKEGAKKNLSLGNIFKGDKPVAEYLRGIPKAKRAFAASKNGASILATLVASVISCNILTPYIRNFYGSYCHDLLRKRNAKMNATIFDIKMHTGGLNQNISDDSPFNKFKM